MTGRTGTDLPILPDKRPDHMGVWDEDADTIWLPREHYPKRIDAIRFAMEQWYCALPDVRCRSRWMRYQPRVVAGYTLDGYTDPGYSEDQWWECEKNDPNAFQVWRLESA